MPKVTIIVPNYNHEKFLRERLDSIFNQTCQDFEVILLDDASSDDSRAIIESYRNHPKLDHIIYNECNSGSTFKQWHRGFEFAKGNYIWIAESDDVAHPDFLKVLLALIDESPSISVAFCQSQIIDDEGKALGDNFKWTQDLPFVDWSRPFEISGDNAIRHLFLFKNIIPNASAVLFRKELLKTLTPEFTDFRYTGDWLVWVEFLQRGDLAYTPMLLNKFRSHSHVSRKRKTIEKKSRYLVEMYAIHSKIVREISIPKSIIKRAKEYLAARAYREIGFKRFFGSHGFSLAYKLQQYDTLFLWRLLKYRIRGSKTKPI